MRNVLLSTVAALALMMSPALAQEEESSGEVDVDAEIFKFKDKDIQEDILKDKAVFLQVQVMAMVEKFAESDLQVYQKNDNNELEEVETFRTDTIENSANTNTGVLSVNQASGNFLNQGNAVSAAVATGADPSFGEAQANAQQINSDVPFNSVDGTEREALITGSVQGGSGITHVNQAVGVFGNQANAVSMAVTTGAGGAGTILTEADLGQLNLELVLTEQNAFRLATLTTSVTNNSGITGVNQSVGNYSNQGNIVAFGSAVIQ